MIELTFLCWNVVDIKYTRDLLFSCDKKTHNVS